MNYYLAPMEGITGYIFRNAYQKYFHNVDCYYTPFLAPNKHKSFTSKEQNDILPEHNQGMRVVPQVLTNQAQHFIHTAKMLEQMGYDEVNLNLGCPSGTVTAKGKGAGMLSNPESLDRFLDAVFAKCPIAISVKTRLGIQSPEEFPALLEVFNRYPIRELTLHPRVRKEFYSSDVHMDWFRYALENSKNPLCYNGNLCTLSDIQAFREQFPQVGAVMIGRGLIGDPGMLTPGGTTVPALEAFFDALLETYTEQFGGPRNAMFRLKENWFYLLRRFEGSEKLGKQLRKTTDIRVYKSITAQIFHTLPLAKELQADW